MKRAAFALLALGVFGFVRSTAALGPEEARKLIGHGPWPLATAADPSNRVSGKPEAIDLGARLFFDARLSANGAISCATCHRPESAFADGRKTGEGLVATDRNTPGLLDVRLGRWFGWDGGGDNLWGQSIRPILDPREMGGSTANAARLLRDDPDLACRYRRSFGRDASSVDDETASVDLAKALAAYQETLAGGRAPFDDFRDALARGDEAGIARYPEAARRGAALFAGRGNCGLCHTGSAFTNGEFHDVGVPFFIRPGEADPGRHGGIRRLKASPYTLLGRFNDDPSRASGSSTRHVALQHRNWGEFKTPSLRNVALTAPYMHNGSLATLCDVVRHYSDIDPDRLHTDGEAILKPLHLNETEIDDLVAFLESLTGRAAKSHAPPPPTPCP